MKQMMLITQEARKKLEKQGQNGDSYKNKPIVKIFTPDANATWLISEISPDDPDILFGLCDLGMGAPELGYVSLSEIQDVRGKFGLPPERDMYITFDKPLMEYYEAARVAGRITV